MARTQACRYVREQVYTHCRDMREKAQLARYGAGYLICLWAIEVGMPHIPEAPYVCGVSCERGTADLMQPVMACNKILRMAD